MRSTDLHRHERVNTSERFVRCSSEFPFFPGAQRVVREVQAGLLGEPIEVHSAFLHSSDLDREKPINWKRRAATCGEIGVMGDLGLHALHVPLRLGWRPVRVAAALQDIVRQRQGPDRRMVPCDTIDNATLLCDVEQGDGSFPMLLEAKRIAPRHMNTWTLRAVGMDGGAEFSTARPKTVRRFTVRDREQVWEEVEVGSQSGFETVTGAIFEFGLSDAILQMWASFLAERAGQLGDAFGCATPQEALNSHRVFAAALEASRGLAVRSVDIDA